MVVSSGLGLVVIMDFALILWFRLIQFRILIQIIHWVFVVRGKNAIKTGAPSTF